MAKHLLCCLVIFINLGACATHEPVKRPGGDYRLIPSPGGGFNKYYYCRGILCKGYISRPSFSTSGKEIVFSLENRNDCKVYKVYTDPTILTLLSKPDCNDINPSFAPDGNMIVFSSYVQDNQADICLMRADGSGRTCLTSDENHDFSPVFSPDGKKVYFLRASYYGNFSPMARPAWHHVDVYSVNTDGSSLSQLTFERYYHASDLSISSDGTALMIKAHEGFKKVLIIWTLADNRIISVKKICPEAFESSNPFNDPDVFDPQISPDGKTIVFAWDENKFWGKKLRQLFILDITSKKIKKITNMDTDVRKPAFLKDGSKIVFNAWEYLWLINSDGSGLDVIEINS